MARSIVLVSLLIAAISAATIEIGEDFGPGARGDAPELKPSLRSLPLVPAPLTSNLYSWVYRQASVLPDGCSFIYGGGSNRLLYVGRVRSGRNVIPAAIHHYGKAGSEFVRYIEASTVKEQTEVEWLCNKGNVGWKRVNDLSRKTLLLSKAIPVGFNASTFSFSYVCLVHSFYSDKYPAQVGTVVNGGCEFEVKGEIVNSNNFNWWHTIELLVITL